MKAKTTGKDKVVDDFDGFNIYRNDAAGLYYINLNHDLTGKFPHPYNDATLLGMKVKIREVTRRNVPKGDLDKVPRISVGDLEKIKEMRSELIRLDYAGTDAQYAKAAKELDELGRLLGVPVWRGLKQAAVFTKRENGIVDWVCAHNISHPIIVPQHLLLEPEKEDVTVHACDGCCNIEPHMAELREEYEQYHQK